MYQAKAYAAPSATKPLGPLSIPRRAVTKTDVEIDVLFCGVCHSDLHQVRDEWKEFMPTVYPLVPGHEIIGRVNKVGSAVTTHKKGDLVGVGCLVDSDRTCPQCADGLENLCASGTFTYNSVDAHKTAPVTYGGYSSSIVVDQHFVLRVPPHLDPAGAAPLLCAGITTYSPLKRFGVRKGMKVGVAGLGGLGHMGVKLAKAFGAHTVVLTTSERKKEDAMRLGADEVIVSTRPSDMERHAGSFHFLLDTISADHDINAYLGLLRHDGNMTLVGAPEKPMAVSAFSLLFGRRSLSGSLIGGIPETQEMLDFCGTHKITSDVEVIPIQRINEAYERLVRSDVRYRFVIDMASLNAG